MRDSHILITCHDPCPPFVLGKAILRGSTFGLAVIPAVMPIAYQFQWGSNAIGG